MKISLTKFFLFLFCVLCSNAKAQYSHSYVNCYGISHIIISNYFKEVFKTDSRILRQNKVKEISVISDSSQPYLYELYEVNKKGLTEKYVKYSGGSKENIAREFYINYNTDETIDWIELNPLKMILFYEYKNTLLSKISSKAEMLSYSANFIYKRGAKIILDSIYTYNFEYDLGGDDVYKIMTDEEGLIKEVREVPSGDIYLYVDKFSDTLVINSFSKNPDHYFINDTTLILKGARAQFEKVTYFRYALKNKRIALFSELKEVNDQPLLKTTEYFYKNNGLIDYCICTFKTVNQTSSSSIFRYNYLFYN